MDSLIIKYITVFGWSMFKFIFGPILSAVFGLGFVPSVLLTTGGMMTSVLLFTLLGRAIRQRWQARFGKGKKLFSAKKRRIVRIWRAYGMWGVAMLTPLLFTPIGGTMIAVSFGEKKHKIIFTMLICGLLWAVFFCGLILVVGKEAFEHWVK